MSTIDQFSLSNEARERLLLIETGNFDIFEFRELVGKKEMVVISSFLMDKHSIYSELKINPETFTSYIQAIEENYKQVPYHNAIHGIDVCQTVYSFVMHYELMDIAQFELLDLAAIIIATTVHDLEHFGYNNAFLIETQHTWAVTYNDHSVCENHHVARAFELMALPAQNIFQHLSPDQFKDMRKRIVAMVLGTDMGRHFEELNKFKTLVDSPEFLVGTKSEEDKIFLMQIAVYMADLSNPTKPWLTSKKWMFLLYQEFFEQGDTEKRLGVPIG